MRAVSITLILLVALLGVTLYTKRYQEAHVAVTSPLGDIDISYKSGDQPDNSPNIPQQKEEPLDVSEETNIGAVYKSIATQKIYFLSQTNNEIKVYERHKIYGDINVGHGLIKGRKVVLNFFSTQANGHVIQPQGLLELTLSSDNQTLKGSFTILGQIVQDVILIRVS